MAIVAVRVPSEVASSSMRRFRFPIGKRDFLLRIMFSLCLVLLPLLLI